jgi:cytochrome c
MIRRLALASALIAVSACGEPAEPSQGRTAAPLDDAERAARAAALPEPFVRADLENGRQVFARCRSCHTISDGGPDMTGPNLHGVFGRGAGEKAGFNYSKALREADFGWDPQALDQWLQNPRTFLPGNKMSFAGIPDAEDRRDVIAYLMVETQPVGMAE